MTTRGLWGFRIGGVDKTTYNHSDSYPTSLGKNIVYFVQKHHSQELKEIAERIVLVHNDDQPTRDQIAEVTEYIDVHEPVTDWYNLLRGIQGEPDYYAQGLRYMIDDHGFIRDSLFCEYGYIINLDDSVLEFWRGFQNKPQPGNRYRKIRGYDWYPCRLAKSFPLEDIPKNWLEQIQTVMPVDLSRALERREQFE